MNTDLDILLGAVPSFQKDKIERDEPLPDFPGVQLQSNDPQRQSPIEVRVQPQNRGGGGAGSGGSFTAIVAVNGLPYYALVNGTIGAPIVI